MKKVLIGLGLVFLMVIVTVGLSTSSDRGDIKNGIATNPPDSALPGNVSFEPPTLFGDALPLELWVSGDVGARFIAGHGAVLDASTFGGITGYSLPNALCFNSAATNADGSKPRLPTIIKFDPPIEYLQLKVGSNTGAGSISKLKAFSTALSKISEDSVSLTMAMKTMMVSSGSKNIELVVLTGPSVMVVDDLIFY